MKKEEIIGGEIKRLSDYPLHLQAIGLVVTDWARLEQRLCLTLWELIGNVNHGSAIFNSLASAKAKIDVVDAVLKNYAPGIIKDEVESCLDSMRALATRRNLIAHGQWGSPADPDRVNDVFVSTTRPLNKKPETYAIFYAQQIEDVANSIEQLNERLASINEILKYKRGPIHELEYEHIARCRALSPEYDAKIKLYLGF